ncbi:MAG TPA: hypothetical protein VNP37_22005 [Actinomycetospora sp.]|nr:hypothetical protein [Actinomycetospora sp.]
MSDPDTARARAARAVDEHATDHRGVDLRELGGGLDHHTFVLGDLVVRVAARATATREAELLRLVAPRVSIPVPAPQKPSCVRRRSWSASSPAPSSG